MKNRNIPQTAAGACLIAAAVVLAIVTVAWAIVWRVALVALVAAGVWLAWRCLGALL